MRGDRFVRHRPEEVTAPIPLQAGRIQAVEGGLQRRVRASPSPSKRRLQSRGPARRPRRPRPDRRCSTRPPRTPSAGATPPGRAARRDGHDGEEAVQRPRPAAGRKSRYQPSTSAVADAGHPVGPPTTLLTGCSRKVNEVTTPKLPPPPRSAQNRSGCWSWRWPSPLAVGEHHLGLDQVVDRQPVLAGQVAVPPPRVRPPTPVVAMMPPGWPGRRRGWRVDLAHRRAAAARARFARRRPPRRCPSARGR